MSHFRILLSHAQGPDKQTHACETPQSISLLAILSLRRFRRLPILAQRTRGLRLRHCAGDVQAPRGSRVA
jgi:hypothetical protein